MEKYLSEMYLLPSEIRFSQSCISNTFSIHLEKQQIGKVLDKICSGDNGLLKKITGNLKIGKSKKPGYDELWFTVNNRSLWVLKMLEALGQLTDKLSVTVDQKGIDDWRFTTMNSGQRIYVRQYPVGGERARPADFWEYTMHARMVGEGMVGREMVGGVDRRLRGGAAFGMDYYDDGYDSDEYYH